MPQLTHLEVGDLAATVASDEGARLASLRVRGHELLVTDRSGGPLNWGCYPMVPWAGRVDRGRFSFRGTSYELPADLGPHAIHGTGYTRPWTRLDTNVFELELGPPWPFGGRAIHTVTLLTDRVRLELEVHATDQVLPVVMGWHPWFRRDPGFGSAARLHFEPGRMYERGPDMIPTGRISDPTPGPWDDCFTDVAADPTIEWGDELRLGLHSDADHWVVYDEPAHAICVEPQTGPPDAFNSGAATVIEPGESVSTFFEIRGLG